jgi:hypothetical protein
MTTISLTVTPTDMLMLKHMSDAGLDTTGLIAHIIELVGDNEPVPEDIQHQFIRDSELISLIKSDRPPRFFVRQPTTSTVIDSLSRIPFIHPRHWEEDDHD